MRLSIAVVETVAAAATNSDPPTYRAMFEMPDACPTWLFGTADVDAEDAGPLESPSPAEIATNGRTNATYSQSDPTNASHPNPTAANAKPIPTA